MGTILASATINKVAGSLLNDAAKVRFTQTDLLEAYNEACRFIAGVNPSSSSNIVPFTCVAGSRQTVPTTAHSLLGVMYNLASDGTSPKRAITTVTRETLDVPNPNWRSMPPKTEVRHIIADDEVPTIFDVYPPVVAGTKIALKVAVIPTAITADQPLPLEDTYESPVMNYMLSRMYQKNAEYASNVERATSYYQSVLQFLGMKAQVDPAGSAEQDTRGMKS